jgi:hypothetical protein
MTTMFGVRRPGADNAAVCSSSLRETSMDSAETPA